MGRRLLVPLTAILLLLGAVPASAEPPGPFDAVTVVGIGSVEFYYEPAADRIRVQVDGDVSGSARTAGIWTLAIAGTRGGVPFNEPLWTSSAYTIVDHKAYVPRLAPVGEFTVDWAYTGVGGYLIVHLVHQVAWTAQTGNMTAGSGINR